MAHSGKTPPAEPTRSLEAVVEDALRAFWEVIARRFPEAETGDLSPLTSISLGTAAETAVREWVWCNAHIRL